MSVGQPGVERHRREFDQETDHQHHEENLLQAFTEEPIAAVDRLSVGRQGRNVKRTACPSACVRQVLWLEEVHRDQAQEHDHRGGEGVDEELLRSVLSIVPAPFEDKEEHGNQGQFPKDVEHEQVEGDENADERTAHHENQREVHGGVLFVPRRNNGDRQEERRQPHHREGEGVHTDGPMDAQGFNPHVADLVVEFAEFHRDPVKLSGELIETEEHGRGDHQHPQRKQKSEHTNGGANSVASSR